LKFAHHRIINDVRLEMLRWISKLKSWRNNNWWL